MSRLYTREALQRKGEFFNYLISGTYIPPKPMMHIAYSPISGKVINPPYSRTFSFFGFPLLFDHDAFTHQALHVLLQSNPNISNHNIITHQSVIASIDAVYLSIYGIYIAPLQGNY